MEEGRPRRMRGCEGQCLDVDLMAGREEMLVEEEANVVRESQETCLTLGHCRFVYRAVK